MTLPIQTINIGSVANDGTGDTLRNAGNKINANFNTIVNNFASEVVSSPVSALAPSTGIIPSFFNTDTILGLLNKITGYILQLTGVWTSYTPVITTQSGSITKTIHYAKYNAGTNKTKHFSVGFSITAVSSATGSIFVTLPTTASNAYWCGTAMNQATGELLCCKGRTTDVVIYKNLAASAIAVGAVFNISGTYEEA